jgi:hypothetical protein
MTGQRQKEKAVGESDKLRAAENEVRKAAAREKERVEKAAHQAEAFAQGRREDARERMSEAEQHLHKS